MYEQYFHFHRRPFPAAPSLRLYVSLETMEEHRAKLTRCLARGEGVGLIVGPAGTGKTLLCRVVGADLRQSCELVMPAVGRVPSRRALFQAILFELRRPYQGLDDGELRLSLMDYLLSEERERPLLLIIDEADTLPLRLLDELRLLLNLARGEEPPLRLLLSGGTVLEEKLAAGRLQSLSQRIATRCYLDALSRAETFTYVREQVRHCGGVADEIFSEEALAAIYHASGGVPRLINQICDHALLLAFADEARQLSPQLIQEAWSDLQQLPMPWETSASTKTGQSQVVEFGAWNESGPTHDLASDLGEAACDVVPPDEHGIALPPGDEQGDAMPPLSEFAGDLDAEVETGDAEDAGGREGSQPRFHGPGPKVGGPSGAFPTGAIESEADSPADVAQSVASDPLRHLETAARAVEQLQHEFSPPSTKTEVELIFQDWGNPFEEEFQQVIRVTGEPIRKRGPAADRHPAASPTNQSPPANAPALEAMAANEMEIVIETGDRASQPSLRAIPIPQDDLPDDRSATSANEAGIAEVLIFDAHADSEDEPSGLQEPQHKSDRPVRGPKFRRLFSQLKRRTAESQAE